ncbi:MAG TPA: hypothetical protein VFB48_05250, partial [Nitrososphaeraceae archaeon]|nr:hypothetical protein [Nitrososphaeraceae archaeon]
MEIHVLKLITQQNSKKLMLDVCVDNYGITVDNKGKKLYLDPNRQPNSDLIFISHAHTDHLYKCV